MYQSVPWNCHNARANLKGTACLRKALRLFLAYSSSLVRLWDSHAGLNLVTSLHSLKEVGVCKILHCHFDVATHFCQEQKVRVKIAEAQSYVDC